MTWDYNNYYIPSRPKKAQGGIKAQNKRGSFGRTWWGKRWIEVIEHLGLGSRLNRGKSYARSGQVLSIEVEKGQVAAVVQGSRAKPYQQTIRFHTLTTAEWSKLAGVLAGQAIYTAKLLAGEMPEVIEQVFKQAGLALFPASYAEVQTKCSCPDYSDPCKHLAAVYYLLAEEFDRDPFLLFKLRGLERDELLSLISRVSGNETGRAAAETPVVASTGDMEQNGPARAGQNLGKQAAGEPLPVEPSIFWQGGDLPEDLPLTQPVTPAALPRQLGNFPFWRGKLGLAEVLEEVYAAAATTGMEISAGAKQSMSITPSP